MATLSCTSCMRFLSIHLLLYLNASSVKVKYWQRAVKCLSTLQVTKLIMIKDILTHQRESEV